MKKKLISLLTLLLFVFSSQLFAQEEGSESEEVVYEEEEVEYEETVELIEEKSMTKAEKAAFKAQKEAEAKALKEQKEAEKKARKEAEKKAKEEAERKAKQRTDEYLGLVYMPVKKLEHKSGKVRIVLMGNTCSFNIYAVDESGNETPVFSNFDEASSSFISALVGKKEYRLNREAGLVAEVRQMDGRSQLAYVIPKTIQVAVDFIPLASVPGGECDMVKVSIYTTNISKKPINVSIKALFDTILGENTKVHFITGLDEKLTNETFIPSMKEARWIKTTNNKVSSQFIFTGNGLSEPEFVAVANRDILSNSSMWVPKIARDRSFSSVLAYNNSAINVNWPEVKLASGKSDIITFYIAVAIDGESPMGEQFVNSLTAEAPVEKVEVVTPAEEDRNTGFIVKKPDVDFIVPPITDRQLDPEYIQSLIDRINNLQSDPNLVDRTEIRRLNSELDAILEKLRQVQR